MLATALHPQICGSGLDHEQLFSSSSIPRSTSGRIVTRATSTSFAVHQQPQFKQHPGDRPKFEKIPRAALPRQLSADAYEHFNQFAEFLTGSDDHSWSDLLEHSPAMRDQRKLLGGERTEKFVDSIMSAYDKKMAEEHEKAAQLGKADSPLLSKFENFLADSVGGAGGGNGKGKGSKGKDHGGGGEVAPDVKMVSDIHDHMKANAPWPQKIAGGLESLLGLLHTAGR